MKKDQPSDYLWDRSGEPDPDVAYLERVLGTLRHRSPLGDRRPDGRSSSG
jgi:hypothetical protein